MKISSQDQLELNLLIHVEDREKLWDFRNLFYKIQGQVRCKLSLFLTANLRTTYNMFLHIADVDIFFSDENYDKGLKEILQERIERTSPKCNIIMRNGAGYIHVCRSGKNFQVIERWNKQNLEEKMCELIWKLYKKNYRTLLREKGDK